ncbi:MAG: hypothetical protein WD875_02220 [Pirellulales bacterium]
MNAPRSQPLPKCWRPLAFAAAMLAPLVLAATGCHFWSVEPQPCPPGIGGIGGGGGATGPSNAIYVPAMDRETLWTNLVDTVDDYFRIDREQRVHQIGDVLTEGTIETQPLIGATYFEPHRRDAANSYERTLGTLQTIRRRATVRVTPHDAGSLVEISVLKEQEDLARAMHSTAGAATFRNDNSLDRRLDDEPAGLAKLRWYPIGRDISLEQTMLDDLQDRLGLPPGRVALAAATTPDAASQYYESRELVTPLPRLEEVSPAPAQGKLDEQWQPR